MPVGRFCQSYHIPGTLSADLHLYLTLPLPCTLIHVSAVASNATTAPLTIGNSDDADEYLTASPIGQNGTPAEYDGDDFVDSSGLTHGRYYPSLDAGTVLHIHQKFHTIDEVDYCADVTLVLTFVH